MYYSLSYKVEFSQNGKNYFANVKAQSEDDAIRHVELWHSPADVYRVSNMTWEDATEAMVSLLLYETKIVRDPQVEKAIKKAIAAFAAVEETEYHYHIKSYPTSTFPEIAKKVFNRMFADKQY
jgi:hypothetical protein